MDHGEAPAINRQAPAVNPDAPPLQYADLAGRVEIALLDPAAGEEQQTALFRTALSFQPAVIVVRPGDVDWAARHLTGPTKLAAVCAYPHGLATTAVKLYEARDLLRRGAREIHVSVAVAKLQSRQFQHVEMELIQLAQACHESGAQLKAVLEMPSLGEEQKLVACKISKRSEVDMAQGSWATVAAADEELLQRKCQPLVRPIGAAHSADEALAQFARGYDRVVLADWEAVLTEFRIRTAPAPVVT